MRTPRLCIRVATANRGHRMSVMSVDLSVNKHNKNSRPSCATKKKTKDSGFFPACPRQTILASWVVVFFYCFFLRTLVVSRLLLLYSSTAHRRPAVMGLVWIWNTQQPVEEERQRESCGAVSVVENRTKSSHVFVMKASH